MTLLASSLDLLSNNLHEPLTRILMGVTLVFGYIRTRWYWVIIFALMVAISHILANHDMTINQRVLQSAGQSALMIFIANGLLMLATYAVGYCFKILLLMIGGPSRPPAER